MKTPVTPVRYDDSKSGVRVWAINVRETEDRFHVERFKTEFEAEARRREILDEAN